MDSGGAAGVLINPQRSRRTTSVVLSALFDVNDHVVQYETCADSNCVCSSSSHGDETCSLTRRHTEMCVSEPLSAGELSSEKNVYLCIIRCIIRFSQDKDQKTE